MKIYHNPRCSTSRKVLEKIREAGVEPQIVLYMTEPLSHKKMASLLRKLKMKPIDLVRKKEPTFKSEYEGKELSDDEWIYAMITHPRLMERPIVEDGRKAILARPIENVEKLLF